MLHNCLALSLFSWIGIFLGMLAEIAQPMSDPEIEEASRVTHVCAW
jgi:hypothetical protein